MKYERRNSCLITALLAALLSFGAVSCMVTGMGMHTVSLPHLLAFCAAFSLISAVLGYYVPHGVLLCACGSILLALGLFWPKGYLTGWASALVYHISSLYSKGYGWPVIQFGTADPSSISLTPSLCAVAGMVALAVTGCLRRRGAVWPGVAAALLPLAVCLVLTDTVPSVWCLILLIGGLAVLLLAAAVRRRSGAEGNRLIMGLLLPVFLAAAVLFAAVPRNGYVLPPDQLGAEFLDWASGLPLFTMSSPGTSNTELEKLSLSSVGPQTKSMIEVMRVVSSADGRLYLRGQAYVEYDGLHWYVQNCAESGWPQTLESSGSTLSVSMRRSLDLLYTPYYVDRQSSDSGSLENTGRLFQYEYSVLTPSGGADLSDQLEQLCLTLPQSTLSRAAALLNDQSIPRSGFLSASSDGQASVAPLTGSLAEQAVEQIADYVRSSARYDLQTPKLPQDEEDFALWFLEDSDTGYCTHFASAAVVLLRAAGIPSRYVTGYMVETEANTSTAVYAYQSHAWVEYYTSAAGWQVLEVTPSDSEPQPTETTQPTQPPETTQQTQPPATTQESRPPESSGETRPAGATEAPTLPPEESGTQEPGEMTAPADFRPLLWAVLAVALGMGAVWGQYALRLAHRRRKLKQGNSRQQALYRWRIARLWGRHVAGHHPPQALKQLAEKAMFSQHEIEPQELARFDEYFAQCAELLRQMPWPKRLTKMLLWALPP